MPYTARDLLSDSLVRGWRQRGDAARAGLTLLEGGILRHHRGVHVVGAIVSSHHTPTPRRGAVGEAEPPRLQWCGGMYNANR
jgi:hypothetical protein